jgi:hypothetical protein
MRHKLEVSFFCLGDQLNYCYDACCKFIQNTDLANGETK